MCGRLARTEEFTVVQENRCVPARHQSKDWNSEPDLDIKRDVHRVQNIPD